MGTSLTGQTEGLHRSKCFPREPLQRYVKLNSRRVVIECFKLSFFLHICLIILYTYTVSVLSSQKFLVTSRTCNELLTVLNEKAVNNSNNKDAVNNNELLKYLA